MTQGTISEAQVNLQEVLERNKHMGLAEAREVLSVIFDKQLLGSHPNVWLITPEQVGVLLLNRWMISYFGLPERPRFAIMKELVKSKLLADTCNRCADAIANREQNPKIEGFHICWFDRQCMSTSADKNQGFDLNREKWCDLPKFHIGMTVVDIVPLYMTGLEWFQA